tara:strand:+ start:110 stop:922 length:813 start_codon:yes stop_codon:yes gene_type:complete
MKLILFKVFVRLLGIRNYLLKIILSKLGIGNSRTVYEITSKYVLRDNDIRHSLPSLIYSKEDLTTTPELVQIIADASKLASKRILKCGKNNLPDSKFLNIFPGEHYRLINAIVETVNAKEIVEIGTFTGMGSLSLKEGFKDVSVTTYDIIKWDKLDFPSHFDHKDFNESLKQIIGDLSDDKFFERNLDILNDADLIFMDAPKDNVFEYKMVKQLKKLNKKNKKLLILDDILFVNMIDFWRKIKSPKVDASSFGHWSGTGIVDISNGFLYE